jgi:phage gpG-like protein
MPVRGDIDGLRKLRDKIAQLTTAGFRQELAQVLAAAALKQVADEFRESRDPYGRPWAPLAWRKGLPLLLTGRMRNAVAVEPRANGFKLSIATVYAKVHQDGARVRRGRLAAGFSGPASRSSRSRVGFIPQRQMVPERSTGGLGPIWLAAFNREAESLIRRRLQVAA